MKTIEIINDDLAQGGFTSGNNGIWTRNEPFDSPTEDYTALSRRLDIPLSRFIRPYQASGDNVKIVTAEHGGSGVIKDNELKKVDGLVTAEKGVVLSVIAADCVPVYLVARSAGVVGLLHCGWRSAAGGLLHNGIAAMKELGASPADIQLIIGPHICADCYEIGAEVREEYAKFFSENELEALFTVRDKRLYLSLSKALQLKAEAEGILRDKISAVNECTCHDKSYHSYRRGDRGRQNLAYLMMKSCNSHQ